MSSDKNNIFKIFISAFIITFFISCEDKKNGFNNAEKTLSIETGQKLFEINCIVCHGKDGVGLNKNWKVKVNGKYPPPPINGTAHAWHHSREILANIIKNGSIKNGGNMPAFTNLSKENIENILDYVYSLWPKDIQKEYNKHNTSL